ncbi:hypothetical protein BH79_15495 [Pseudomonas aeruginosa C0324C]|nr:hypothetical protein BH79_15495 [Pseudomonas aeruginosa C0324C]
MGIGARWRNQSRTWSAPSDCAPGRCRSGCIQRVSSLSKLARLPAKTMTNSSQLTSSPDQVCRPDID